MLRSITGADDPDLASMAALLHAVFPDQNTVLGLERLREFVAERNPGRAFNMLIVKDNDVVVGCTVFSYVPASNCGFSEYIAVSQAIRGGGTGRRLFDARREVLDRRARTAGYEACNGLFIEADNPRRVPPELLERERQTAIDAQERLRVFAHLGFRRVDVAYVQPPLGVGKEPVSYMDLLFAPWRARVDAIDSTWVTDTVQPIWRAWSPDTYRGELAALQASLPRPTVRLVQLID